MSLDHNDSFDKFDADFLGGSQVIGFSSGYHETGPDFPGDVPLDDEAFEDFMNLQVRQEVDRLRREVPDLRQFHITPGLHWSGDAENLTVDALPWKVTFFAGEGLYIGDGPTLQAAMMDGIDGYKAKSRAQTLDMVSAVAEEGRAA